jgi:hypothetical protein
MEYLKWDLDYGFSLTVYEMLEEVIRHCERACEEETLVGLGEHLKMASRAMRCALEIYGWQLEEVQKRKDTGE